MIPDLKPLIAKRKWLITILMITSAVATLVVLDASYFNWSYTGIGTKTLWDWLDLLIIPAVIAVGGYWFSRAEKRYEIDIQDNRLQENTLQTYLDGMSELLLDYELCNPNSNAQSRRIARSLTLTTLRRLNGERKG